MTRGRRGNQTYTGFNGASDHALRSLRLSDKSDPNPQNRKLPPSREAMLRAIEAGLCPYCGDPFKNIGAHTSRTHGVPTPELKEYLGIPKSRPICSPELSEQWSEERKARLDESHMKKMRGSKLGGRRKLSEAGKQANREKLAKWRESTGDQGRRQQKEASQALKRRWEEEKGTEYEEAFKLIREGYMMMDVAEHLGMHKSLLSRKWRERHPDIDLRSYRHRAKRMKADG